MPDNIFVNVLKISPCTFWRISLYQTTLSFTNHGFGHGVVGTFISCIGTFLLSIGLRPKNIKSKTQKKLSWLLNSFYVEWSFYTTVCQRNIDPTHIVTYHIKWVKDSWTKGTCRKIHSYKATPCTNMDKTFLT